MNGEDESSSNFRWEMYAIGDKNHNKELNPEYEDYSEAIDQLMKAIEEGRRVAEPD